MALSRIEGKEDIYVSGIFALRKPSTIKEHNIRAILSVIDYSFVRWDQSYHEFAHLTIDIDDIDSVDILVRLPKMVRFIERGLYGDEASLPEASSSNAASSLRRSAIHSSPSAHAPAPSDPDAISIEPIPAQGQESPGPPSTTAVRNTPGAVLVHCAMGKSRSVSAVIAYLLWKHPHRYGASEARNANEADAASRAVARALKWVQQSRAIAEPNPGFMRQLEMWWIMSCPCDSDDAVERHPRYQRWLYERELDESRAMGRAPGWIVFGDEKKDEGVTRESVRHAGGGKGLKDTGQLRSDETANPDGRSVEVRCKRCRRVLATQEYIVVHQPASPGDADRRESCPHVFVETLSWMRPMLETGALDGRLVCPNAKCGATVGRFAWQGFKCSCGEWVCPAFSLNKAKVDEVPTARLASRPAKGAATNPDSPVGQSEIRMPPTLAGGHEAALKENL